MNLISKIVVCALLIIATIIIFINIFIPPVSTLSLLIPWILLLFAFLFLICTYLNIISTLLENICNKEGDE